MSSDNTKAIVITGANGGVGMTLVRYFLEQGQRNLALVARSESTELVELLKSFDIDPVKHVFSAELTDEQQVTRMCDSILQKFGGVQGVLNLAGGSTNGMSWKLSKADFQNIIDQNLLSAFLCCKSFIPVMREAGVGRIINFSSVTGSTGIAGASHYAAAKSGLVGFTKSLALELAPKKITANVLVLGYFTVGLITHLTPELQEEVKARIPLKRFGNGNEIGGAIKFLLSPDGAYTTGQEIHINGGLYG